MKIQLHENAIKNFNEKADNLLFEIVPDPNAKKSNPLPSYSEIVIQDLEIIEITKIAYTSIMDGETGVIFYADNKPFGLFEDGYKQFIKLVESVYKDKIISAYVHFDTLKDLIFDWIAARYKNETALQMTEFVLPKCEDKIKEIEIWLPVHRLIIESEFSVGKITFKTITTKMIDEWHTEKAKHGIGNQEEYEVYLFQEREKLQGFAATTIKLEAEAKRALEIAFEEANKALSLLRLFGGGAFHPKVVSYCVLLGMEHLQGITELNIKDGKIIHYSSSDILCTGQ